ncbi:MAG: HepT-like ribonuclease domain-containing protein [Patescibacteria group bacterium]
MDKDKIYLEEIRDFCRKVADFTSGRTYEQFAGDEILCLAVIKLIENIGEASKRLSSEARSRYPRVDWKKVMAMRDRLVHHYMDVDLAIVFDVAANEVPLLFKALKQK